MTRRVIHVLFLIAAVIVMMAAPMQAADKEEVVVWLWSAHSTDEYWDLYEKLATWFEDEYPGYTLRFELSGQGSGESLITAVAGGVPPDVTLVSVSSIQGLYERGVLMGLNEFIEKTPHLTPDNFLPVSLESGQKDGVIFGLPWSLEARAVLYNKQHLEESGLDVDRRSLASWDDVLSYAQRLTRRDPQGQITRSGFIMGLGLSNFAAYLHANGGDFYNADGTAVAFNNDKGVEMLELMHRFTNEHDVMRTGAGIINLRSDKSASMGIGDTSSVVGFQRYHPEDFFEWLDMAPIPPGPQGEGTSTVLWSNSFVIPNGVQDPAKAWKFFEFWFRPDVQELVFLQFGGNVVKTARQDFFQTNVFHDSLRQFPYLAVKPEIVMSAKPYPFIRFSEINSAIGPLIRQAQSGDLAPASALADAERIANAILSQ